MHARVDDTCIACGVCPDLCPEVFDLPGDKAVVKVDPVPPQLEEDARQAAESCPVQAIHLED